MNYERVLFLLKIRSTISLGFVVVVVIEFHYFQDVNNAIIYVVQNNETRTICSAL